MMINSKSEAPDDKESLRSESVFYESDSDAESSDADTAVTTEHVTEALEIMQRISDEVKKYGDTKIHVRALKQLLTPYSTIKIKHDGTHFLTPEKTMPAEHSFLYEVVKKYIKQYGSRASLREFTLFLNQAIRTAIDQEEQGKYSKVCLTILARFAGKNFAYETEEYRIANQEDRSAIKSNTRRVIGEVITYLLNPEDETDTTPPFSEAPVRN